MQNHVSIVKLDELVCGYTYFVFSVVRTLSVRLATQKDAYEWNQIVESDLQGNFLDRFEWCQGLGVISEKKESLQNLFELLTVRG